MCSSERERRKKKRTSLILRAYFLRTLVYSKNILYCKLTLTFETPHKMWEKRKINFNFGLRWFMCCFFFFFFLQKKQTKFDANRFPWLTNSVDWKRCAESEEAHISGKSNYRTNITNSPLQFDFDHNPKSLPLNSNGEKKKINANSTAHLKYHSTKFLHFETIRFMAIVWKTSMNSLA